MCTGICVYEPAGENRFISVSVEEPVKSDVLLL